MKTSARVMKNSFADMLARTGKEVGGGFGGRDLLGAQLRGQLGHAQLVQF